VKQFQITKLAVCKLRAQPDPQAGGKTDFITLFDITVFLSLCWFIVIRFLKIRNRLRDISGTQSEIIFSVESTTAAPRSGMQADWPLPVVCVGCI